MLLNLDTTQTQQSNAFELEHPSTQMKTPAFETEAVLKVMNGFEPGSCSESFEDILFSHKLTQSQ